MRWNAFQNGTQKTTEIAKMRPRMLPGPSQESLKMASGATSALKFMRLAFRSNKSGCTTALFSFFGSFLGTGRAQKIDQNRPRGQKGVPKDGAKSDFCAFAVFSRFFLTFEAKIRPKINENLNVFFWCCVCFFQTRESQILCTGAVF